MTRGKKTAALLLLSLFPLAAPAPAQMPAEKEMEGLSAKTDAELRALLEKAAREREAAPPAKGIDYSGIDRTIGKEPAYTAQPLYCLFLLDREGKFRVWAVFDKSAPDARHYDVLYLDKNGNGDLTEEGERFTGGEKIMVNAALQVPGAKGLEHRCFCFGVSAWKVKEPYFSGAFLWDAKKRPHLVYPDMGTRYEKTPAEAPVIHPDPEGFLTFALRHTPGTSRAPVISKRPGNPMSFWIGNPGDSPDNHSFTALCVDHYIHFGKKDLVVATVIAKDAEGREVRKINRITERC